MFAQTAKQNANTKLTENGALAYSTSGKVLTDLFAQIGALRPRTVTEIENKFASAFNTDPLIATKMMFYAGNIRGGLGERRTFRICLKWLAKNHPDIVKKNIHLIPEYNRWDSMCELIGTPVETAMWENIGRQLSCDAEMVVRSREDKKPYSISLLAKWMPTETAHSPQTRKLARKAIKALGLTPRQYRKLLSALREYLNIVERAMSAGNWDSINYEAVPSYAMKNYRKAFEKRDGERFATYTTSLVKGEAKVNASTLYPYDLIGALRKSMTYDYRIHKYTCKYDPIIEEQWKALPNYVSGENNILIMADVSGSMDADGGRPMNTSVGLATYFAQRNNGEYHNLYMTFTDSPHFVSLKDGDTLANIVPNVMGTDIGYNSNLEKAFMYILKHAMDHNISNNDLPKALVVVSDMEIDNYARWRGFNFVDEMDKRFAAHGYKMPKLVCWNVEARNDTFLSQNDNVILVSGQSVSTFKNLCGCLDGKTAWDFMMEVLNDEMYNSVRV